MVVNQLTALIYKLVKCILNLGQQLNDLIELVNQLINQSIKWPSSIRLFGKCILNLGQQLNDSRSAAGVYKNSTMRNKLNALYGQICHIIINVTFYRFLQCKPIVYAVIYVVCSAAGFCKVK